MPGMLTFSKVVNGALEVVSRVGSSGGREISRRRVSQDDSAWQSLGGVTRQMFHQWRSEVKSNADSNNDSERAGMPVTSTLWSDSGNILIIRAYGVWALIDMETFVVDQLHILRL